MRWNEVLLNYPSLSLQSENRPFLPLMEFNLLDYIITDVLLTHQPRAAALLNHPPIARIVAHHIRSLEARIQAVYETRHGVRQIVRCDGFSIVPTRDLLVQTAHGVMTIGAYMLQRHGLIIDAPEFPALRCVRGGHSHYYALEHLDILFYDDDD